MMSVFSAHNNNPYQYTSLPTWNKAILAVVSLIFSTLQVSLRGRSTDVTLIVSVKASHSVQSADPDGWHNPGNDMDQPVYSTI